MHANTHSATSIPKKFKNSNLELTAKIEELGKFKPITYGDLITRKSWSENLPIPLLRGSSCSSVARNDQEFHTKPVTAAHKSRSRSLPCGPLFASHDSTNLHPLLPSHGPHDTMYEKGEWHDSFHEPKIIVIILWRYQDLRIKSYILQQQHHAYKFRAVLV